MAAVLIGVLGVFFMGWFLVVLRKDERLISAGYLITPGPKEPKGHPNPNQQLLGNSYEYREAVLRWPIVGTS